jgi:hypothetical protein
MIHIVTQRNFPILDLQIEEAYRRRCQNARSRACACISIETAMLLSALDNRSRPSDRGFEWLNRLALAMDRLAHPTKRRRSSPRMTGVVAANSKKSNGASASGRKRRRAASL